MRNIWKERMMNNNIFYEVVQNGRGVGFFKKLENAEQYADGFNTKTKVLAVKIIKRYFLDDIDMCDAGD